MASGFFRLRQLLMSFCPSSSGRLPPPLSQSLECVRVCLRCRVELVGGMAGEGFRD